MAALLEEPLVTLLGRDEVEVFRWRVARMRAYATGEEAMPPAPAHPYVELARAIDDVRRTRTIERRFAARDPGYFMLLPQARRLGLIEDE